MTDYKEISVTGKSWQRCCRISIDNPVERSSEIVFYEEKALNFDNSIITTPIGHCKAIFDPLEVLTLLDPNTGNVTGSTITHAEIYTILYSLYIDTATKRDTVST